MTIVRILPATFVKEAFNSLLMLKIRFLFRISNSLVFTLVRYLDMFSERGLACGDERFVVGSPEQFSSSCDNNSNSRSTGDGEADINMMILQILVSGIFLVLGLRARM